jgi:chromosome segregation ATPase
MSETRSCIVNSGYLDATVVKDAERTRLEQELAGVRRDLRSLASTANNLLLRAQTNGDRAAKAEQELAKVNAELSHFQLWCRVRADEIKAQATEIGNRDKAIANQRAELREQQKRNDGLKQELAEALTCTQNMRRELMAGRTGPCVTRESHEQIVAENREFYKQSHEKAIAEKDEQIRCLQTDLVYANGRLLGMNQVCAERKIELTTALDRAKELESDLAQSNRVRDGLAELVKTRGDNLSRQADTILQQTHEIAQLRKSWVTLNDFNAAAAEYHAIAAKQRVMIEDRDRHIAELQKEVQELKNRYAPTAKTVTVSIGEGATFVPDKYHREEIEALQKENADLDNKLARANKNFEFARGVVHSRASVIEELEKQIRELKEPQAVPVGLSYRGPSSELIQRAIHDERVAELREKLDLEARNNAHLHRTIGELERKIDTQNKHIGELRGQIEVLRAVQPENGCRVECGICGYWCAKKT